MLRGWGVFSRRLAALLLAAACGFLLTSGGAQGRGTPAPFRVGFLVKVLGVDDSGTVVPLSDAVVGVHPGSTSGTDARGFAFVEASPSTIAGDVVTIDATKNGYAGDQVKLVVDRDTWVLAHRNVNLGTRYIAHLQGIKAPVITLTLTRQAGETVDLVVQVKDAQLKPVQGAVVGLNRLSPPIGPVTHSYTGVDGEATFFVPASLIESGLQARVHAGARGSRFSDIPTSVIGSGQRIFLVILPGKPGTFMLNPALTEIKNPNAPELTIDAPGGTALDDHTGPYGGAGNAGDWRTHYTWHVPGTLIAGKDASITLGLDIADVNPVQPLLVGMTALAPNFAQQLTAHYPDQPTASKTYTVPIAADEASAQEITVTVGVLSAQVIYHYER